MNTRSALRFALAAGLLAGPLHAQDDAPYLKPDPQSLAAWRDMAFGMFIHWGPNCQKGQEISWSRQGPRRGRAKGGTGGTPMEVYDSLYKTFNPEQFNADEWVRIARDAGMKYMVLTAKHHDGFSMFDSAATDYDIMATPFKRDVVKELAEACRRGGIRFGVYYSPRDWYHPDFATERHDRYLSFYLAQLRELATNYGDLLVVWFDGLDSPRDVWKDVPRESFEMLRGLQPRILLNNRGGLPGDFDTPEQRIGGFNRDRAWETCMTICRQWSWKPDDSMKSLEQCIRTLLSTKGGDGNLLFNVGPMPDGRIEPRQADRLKEMGGWLARFGEGVYGTRGGPYKPGAWGASTCKGNRIFLYVFDWPEGGLVLPAPGLKVQKARTLAGRDVECTASADGALTLALPAEGRDPIATVVELTVEGDAFSVAPMSVGERPSGSLTRGKSAKASVSYPSGSAHGPAKALDDDPETRWATPAGTSSVWFEVDLGAPAEIGSLYVDERDWNRVRKFALQVREGENWRTVLGGTSFGADFRRTFDPVTARHVRLNILESTEGPTLWEFRLFPPQR